MARFLLSAALLAVSGCHYADAEGVTSRLQVIVSAKDPTIVTEHLINVSTENPTPTTSPIT
jgi:hypothetical protein